MLNTAKLRRDFPIFSRQINGYPLAYLDNAATTQKPRQVVDAISDYYSNHNANINRGVHQLAEESTELYEKSRKTVANFIKAKPEEIIFVRNTSEAINLIVYGWALHNLKPGDEIITTIMEHHSNIVPWQIIAQKTGAVIKYIDIDENGELLIKKIPFIKGDRQFARRMPGEAARGFNGPIESISQVGSLSSLLTDRTKLVTLTHVSNTLGTINPIQEITKQVKKYNKGIITVVDAAQSIPHMPISVSAESDTSSCRLTNTDFLTFSGHKMLGPMGIGVLWGEKEILERMNPFLGGGDMIAEVYLDHTVYNKIPQKFEAGTPNVAGAVGLAAACKYLLNIKSETSTSHQPMDLIHQHEQELISYTMQQLQQFPQVKILGTLDPTKRSGLISFEFKGIHAHDIAQILDSIGVAVRSGHHCTMPLHNHIQVPASTRISTYLYNTKEEIDKVIEGLKKAKKIFKIS